MMAHHHQVCITASREEEDTEREAESGAADEARKGDGVLILPSLGRAAGDWGLFGSQEGWLLKGLELESNRIGFEF